MDTVTGQIQWLQLEETAVTVCCAGTWAGLQSALSSVANKLVPIISYQILGQLSKLYIKQHLQTYLRINKLQSSMQRNFPVA